MKQIKLLICTAIAIVLSGCANWEQEEKQYLYIDNIQNTLWYSYDTLAKVYYDIEYGDTKQESEDATEWYNGKMTGYDSYDRENEIEHLSKTFTYIFTPAQEVDNTRVEAVVRLMFEDGTHYGGEVIPKGALQISNKDVYIVQLYETDDKWNVILTEDGKAKTSLMMWKE